MPRDPTTRVPQQTPKPSSKAVNADDRLNSWKEIASYLNASVRTVQRWERTVGLPIKRRAGAKRNLVYAYCSELDGWWSGRSAALAFVRSQGVQHATSLAEPSIAVLPFANMNHDEEGDFFCDGITEDITSALTRVRRLRVAPRSSAFEFRGPALNVREAAHRLNVTSVLEGSVRRSGNRFRITVDLVDVLTGYSISSERFDGVMEDIFAVQDKISQDIVSNLMIRLVGDQSRRMRSRYTDNWAAYSLYLKGRFRWNQRTPEALSKAQEHFKQALTEDPAYALAQAGIADCYAMAAAYSLQDPREALPMAKAAALKALEMDDQLAEAHNSLAFYYALYEYEWSRAEQGFRRAIDLNPNYATARSWLAWFVLLPWGRFDEAATEARAATVLDPHTPVNNLVCAMTRYMLGHHSAALEDLKQPLRSAPDHLLANWVLAHVQIATGDYEEAIRTCEKISVPGFGDGLLGYACARSGKTDQAKIVLDRLEERSRRRFVPAAQPAQVLLGLERWDEAFHHLERACEQRGPTHIWLKTDPLYSAIRSDSRFPALLKKLRLEA